ncbi:MAG: hypothetical protein KW793_01660 [Candidatus Doudnabacteria bacterium]|nr:hypothetical protein [Candidatus Doudnabacteria bacterium]
MLMPWIIAKNLRTEDDFEYSQETRGCTQVKPGDHAEVSHKSVRELRSDRHVNDEAMLLRWETKEPLWTGY